MKRKSESEEIFSKWLDRIYERNLEEALEDIYRESPFKKHFEEVKKCK